MPFDPLRSQLSHLVVPIPSIVLMYKPMQMDQFKVLAVTFLYNSLRDIYNKNKHKGIKIKKLVTFLK